MYEVHSHANTWAGFVIYFSVMLSIYWEWIIKSLADRASNSENTALKYKNKSFQSWVKSKPG